MTKQQFIKSVRLEKGLTQEEASKLLDFDRAHLSKYESGRLKLTNDMFFKIMKAYNQKVTISVNNQIIN